MVTVTTKEELETALKNKEAKIVIQGEIANEFVKKYEKRKKAKKGAMIGGIGLTALGLVLLPFSFGASSGVVASGLTATIGGATVVMTTAEVAIVMGVLGVGVSTALLKNYEVVVGKDYVEMTNKKKQNN